jgi:hypothetical protein
MAISPNSTPDKFDVGTAGDRFEGVGLPDALITELRPLARLMARQAAAEFIASMSAVRLRQDRSS